MNKKVEQELNKIMKRYNYRSIVDVNWNVISIYQQLSEDFIKEFKNKLDWPCVSNYQKLSEDFIREIQDYVNWDCISYKKILSEHFIREFKSKLNWYYISYKQMLSDSFIKEFRSKLDLEAMLKCDRITKKFYYELKHPKKISRFELMDI